MSFTTDATDGFKMHSFSNCSQATSVMYHKVGKFPGLSPSNITWGSEEDRRGGKKEKVGN